MSDIKVGQIWRCNGGAELRVTFVWQSCIAFKDWAGLSSYYSPGTMTPANGWELVSDVACNKCGHATGLDQCPWRGTDEVCSNYSDCSWAHSPGGRTCTCATQCNSPDACPTFARVLAPKPNPCAASVVEFQTDASVPQGYWKVDGHLQKAPWWEPKHACAALRETLPTSEGMYLEDSVGECEPAEQAINEVRRKLARLREWPTCPVDGTPYGVEASVREEREPAAVSNLRRERMRLWQARCVCASCNDDEPRALCSVCGCYFDPRNGGCPCRRGK